VTPHDDLVPDRKRRVAAAGERWGYGYMWWVWDADQSGDAMAGAYSARGLGGQFITVIPGLDLVIAHKTNIRVNGVRRRVTAAQYADLVRMVVAARCGTEACR
jgi:CubicO group peptidase (beta-lactamase class C family)